MTNLLVIYARILKDYLSTCFEGEQSIDPIRLNQERFTTKVVFISVVVFLKHHPRYERNENIVQATNDWLKHHFSETNLLSPLLNQTADPLRRIVGNCIAEMTDDVAMVDIPVLYENLLAIETENEGSGAETLTSKNYRNKLGSYYTPADLARAVTGKTIDTFFGAHPRQAIPDMMSSIEFVDFSCGGGVFIIQVIDYFERMFQELGVAAERKTDLFAALAIHISAFDVDWLALEVAKISLLLRIGQPTLYQAVSSRFIHANFLLHTETMADEQERLAVFSSGFIYHEKLALNIHSLKKYDVILGNPPWEKIRFEEKKFYALYSSVIADLHFKANRTSEIDKDRAEDTALSKFAGEFKAQIEKAKEALKKNGFFSNSNNGELNTYALFTEASLKLRSGRGVAGLVLKSAIVTSQVNQQLFQYCTGNRWVISVYDFINRKKIFNIDSRERFCFLLLGHAPGNEFTVSMNLTDIRDIEQSAGAIALSYEDLASLNPATGMLPNFSTPADLAFLLRVSRHFSTFKQVFAGVRFGRIVHLTNHADFIRKDKTDTNIPIYEGKFFNQFDGKFSGFNGVGPEGRYESKSSSVALTEDEKAQLACFPEARWFIDREKWVQLSKNYSASYMLAWRSLTSATNTRTSIATLLPFTPASQSVQFLTTKEEDLLYLTGLFNSIVFDLILKKKLSGIDLTQSVVNQMPVLGRERMEEGLAFNGQFATIKTHVSRLVFFLLKDDTRLQPLFGRLGMDPGVRVSEGRAEIIRSLDLLFIYLYRLSDNELELVLDGFPKQYSDKDRDWFREKLDRMYSDKTVTLASNGSAVMRPI